MQAKRRQIERRDMEENEKWMPHPTSENIFINQEDVLRIQHISSIGGFESESCN